MDFIKIAQSIENDDNFITYQEFIHAGFNHEEITTLKMQIKTFCQTGNIEPSFVFRVLRLYETVQKQRLSKQKSADNFFRTIMKGIDEKNEK